MKKEKEYTLTAIRECLAKNMLMENEPVDKIARYTGLSEEELLRIKAKCAYTQGVTLG